MIHILRRTWPRTSTHTLHAGVLLAVFGMPALAQETPAPKPPATAREIAEHFQRDSVDREYKLRYAQSQADQNEILTALRNMVDPQTKIFLVPSKSIIVVHAPEETQSQLARMLAALDLPQSRYRLTYTVTEMDGTRRIGVQHFSMIAGTGQHAVLKDGSRLPIRLNGPDAASGASQYTYIDVGMNFDATLTEVQGGVVLKSKVEQTSIASESITPSNPNPLIRQVMLEGTTPILLNKPLTVGSLDVPGSTRHFDVEVLLEQVS